MDFRALQERCRNRSFDEIVVVTRDIFRELANLQRIEHVIPGEMEIRTQQTHPGLRAGGEEIAYIERSATVFYENTSLRLVEPVEGNTIYRRYLDRFGEGICCIRERIQVEQWQRTLEHLEARGYTPVQTVDTDQCQAAWIDLMDPLGIVYEMLREDSRCEEPMHVVPARLSQINISTPDVRSTIAFITDLLEIGPWEVGCQSNSCATDYGFLVNGKLEETEFSFLLAILVCGNIEWEVIEPVKGPLVYNEFLEQHGIGFHHILQEYPAWQWQEVLADYEKNNIRLNCKGKLGPVEWCYMDTSRELGFFKEMRTDAVMDRLPEGYLQFFYPEQNQG